MKICFDVKEFKDWLEKIGCSDCQYYPELEGSNIIHRWEYTKVVFGTIMEHEKHRDIELRGEILGKIKNISLQKKWNKIIGKDKESEIKC